MVQELKCPKCGSTNIVDTDRFGISVIPNKVRPYYADYCKLITLIYNGQNVPLLRDMMKSKKIKKGEKGE